MFMSQLCQSYDVGFKCLQNRDISAGVLKLYVSVFGDIFGNTHDRCELVEMKVLWMVCWC